MSEWSTTIGHAVGTSMDTMVAQVLGLFLATGSTFSVAALFVSLGLFVVLAVPRGRQRPVRLAILRRALFPRRLLRTASGRADLIFFIGGVLFAGIAIGWAVVSAAFIQTTVAARLGAPVWDAGPGWVPAAIVTIALFLAYEFAYWLDHWLKHRVIILWYFHKVHHQAESLSLLTNGRVHPVDTIVFHNIVAAAMGLTGALLQHVLGPRATPLTLGGTNILIMVSAVALTHLQHSHLWWDLGPRWTRWLLGPAHHQIHHSADPAHFNRNLGSSLAVFDRLFGTFHSATGRPAELRFGVDDDECDPHGFHAGLVRPFMDAARDVKTGATRAWRFAVGRTGRRRRDRAASVV